MSQRAIADTDDDANLGAMGDTVTMTRRQAAAYLGVSISTIDWLRRRGDLSTLTNKYTHHVRIPLSDAVNLKNRRDEYVPSQRAG